MGRHTFERIEANKADLKEMFAYNKYKLQIIEDDINSDTAALYRCGDSIDLGRGPHLRHTGRISAINLYKVGMTTVPISTTIEHFLLFSCKDNTHCFGSKQRKNREGPWDLFSVERRNAEMDNFPRGSRKTRSSENRQRTRSVLLP